MALTPRGGLARPSASLGVFDDIAGVEGGGAEEPSRRVFGVLDLERGFVPDREVTASGTALSTRMGATRVRPGLGCALELDAAGTMRLSSQQSGPLYHRRSVTLTFSI